MTLSPCYTSFMPATAKQRESKPEEKVPPVKRIRALQVGFNKWKLIEETWESKPTSVRTLHEGTTRVSAEDRVRLYLEESLGLNRFGDSGL